MAKRGNKFGNVNKKYLVIGAIILLIIVYYMYSNSSSTSPTTVTVPPSNTPSNIDIPPSTAPTTVVVPPSTSPTTISTPPTSSTPSQSVTIPPSTSPTTVTVPPSTAPSTVTVPPSTSSTTLYVVAGYNNDGYYNRRTFDTSNESPHVDFTNIDACAAEVIRRGGANALIYRSNAHPAPSARNTCVGLNLPPGYTASDGMNGPVEHNASACSSPSKRWPNCA